MEFFIISIINPNTAIDLPHFKEQNGKGSIHHLQRKKILVEDFTNLKAGEEMLEIIKIAQAVLTQQPPKSVLAVFDTTGASFNNEVLSAMKNFTKTNTPYVKAATVVGINGLLQIALTAVSKFSERDFISFKTRTEAMDWLAER